MGFRGKRKVGFCFEDSEAIICNSLIVSACHYTFAKTIEIYSTWWTLIYANIILFFRDHISQDEMWKGQSNSSENVWNSLTQRGVEAKDADLINSGDD